MFDDILFLNKCSKAPTESIFRVETIIDNWNKCQSGRMIPQVELIEFMQTENELNVLKAYYLNQYNIMCVRVCATKLLVLLTTLFSLLGGIFFRVYCYYNTGPLKSGFILLAIFGFFAIYSIGLGILCCVDFFQCKLWKFAHVKKEPVDERQTLHFSSAVREKQVKLIEFIRKEIYPVKTEIANLENLNWKLKIASTIPMFIFLLTCNYLLVYEAYTKNEDLLVMPFLGFLSSLILSPLLFFPDCAF